MFVGTTFHSSVDRLSIKSILTGKTGTFIGFIFSIFFIMLCFILFIGPIINYFNGDFIQSTFMRLKLQQLELYSGCDYKFAMSFFNKQTRQIVDLRNLENLFDFKIYYVSNDGDQFTAQPQYCDDSYFGDYQKKPQNMSQFVCLRVPDRLGYFTQFVDGYVSIIGLLIEPLCNDPLTCTYKSAYFTDVDDKRVQFFKDHFYQFYFTSQIINRFGEKQLQFHKFYSTEWQGHDTVIPAMYSLLETQTFYIDDSIMPWRNQISHSLSSWYGKVYGISNQQQDVLSSGTRAFITTKAQHSVTYREYKKLDWLLGMIGGGIFLIYVFFYIPVNYLNRAKSEKKVCQSMLVLRKRSYVGQDALEKLPDFGVTWYLSRWLPKRFKVHRKQNMLINIANKYVDIANLIKKQKITLRNIRRNERNKQKYQITTYNLKKQIKFEMKKLNFQEQEVEYNGYQPFLQLTGQQKQLFSSNQKIPQIYENNQTVLTLNASQNAQTMLARLQKKYDSFSKQKISFQSSYRTCFKKIKLYFAQVIRFFDIFGAKPMLSGNPYHYSYISTIITIIITILSILVFAMTIHNMDKTKIRVQKVYASPDQYHIKMESNSNYKMLFCASNYAIDNGLIMGQQRVADIKYYRYHRLNQKQSYEYFSPIWIGDQPGQYFDISDSAYEGFNFNTCFKPPPNIIFEVMGSPDSQQQIYFGVSLKPYCSGTTSYCKEKRSQIIQQFSQVINGSPLFLLLADSKYLNEAQRIVSDFSIIDVNYYNSYSVSNISSAYETIMYCNSIQLIDNTDSWIVGDPPQAHYKTLTFVQGFSNFDTLSVDSDEFQFRAIVKHSGQVTRIIQTNYKIDFLFATMGGCFMVFYMVFGWLGKKANNYFLKARIAKDLYSENISSQGFGCFKDCFKCFRIPCVDDRALQKVHQDLQFISVAQRTDNMYRLSANYHQNLAAKQLSQVYLKEVIKEDDPILQPVNQEQIIEQFEDIQDDSIQIASFQSNIRQQQQRLQNSSSSSKTNAVINIHPVQSKENLIQKQLQIQDDLEQEQTRQQLKNTNRYKQRCRSLINNFDIFSDDSYLTLDGKRQVRSMCGGFCCCILLIFIILLTSHFLTVYSSQNDYILSYERAVFGDIQSQFNTVQLLTGQNFKFALSFITKQTFYWQNVSNFVKGVGISVHKIKTELKQSGDYQDSVQIIDLIECPSNYLDGFVSQYADRDFYNNLTLGYCIPDGVQLRVAGTPNQTREYFKVSIYNKEGSALGKKATKQLLGNYLPIYHISYPIKDFKQYTQQEIIRYSMLNIQRFTQYQQAPQVKSNITFVRTLINYDTALNPASQYPQIKTYNVQQFYEQSFFSFTENQDGNTMNHELEFEMENYVSRYTVKKIKANQLLGLIGGCILVVFVGIGILPKSFNQYRMRVLIGSKLYTIRPTTKIKKNKVVRKGGKIVKKTTQTSQFQLFEQFNSFSEWRIFKAWVLSHIGFIIQDYYKFRTLKMISLIESRVSNDMNVVTYFKNIFICEKYLNNSKQLNFQNNKNINLCRVFPKISVPNDLLYERIQPSKIDKDLRYLAKKNQFSDWDINAILLAKNQAKINPVKVFQQKWLDEYFQVDRLSQIDHRSDLGSSRGQSFAHLMREDQGMERQQSNIQEDTHSIE